MNPKARLIGPNDKRLGNLLRFPKTKTAVAALALALFFSPLAPSATIIAKTDVPDINADEQCSLTEAIDNAKADRAIHADCIAGSGVDTIIVNDLAYDLTRLPVITSVATPNNRLVPGEPGNSNGILNEEILATETIKLDRNLSATEYLESGTECVLAGGLTAVTEDGGFCLISDLNTPTPSQARLLIANALPITGAQFLQATFSDGSTMSGSSPIDANSECVSADGSVGISENGGFCLVAGLNTSIADIANFSIANGLPATGMQFLQVTFADSPSSGTDASMGMGAECVSGGGSSARGNAGGFCLSSDLTATAGSASARLSFANQLPAAGLQFLQVTFADTSPLSEADSFAGTECLSVGGSTAVSGNPDGSCLASDIGASTLATANISFANGLLVTGMQLLQVTFDVDGSLSGSDGIPVGGTGPVDAQCLSENGSSAIAGNADGFCLVSDLGLSATNSANFAVANDLPIIDLHFLQVPSEQQEASSASVQNGSLSLLNSATSTSTATATPDAVAISNLVSLPIRQRLRRVRNRYPDIIRRILPILRRFPRIASRFPPAIDGIAGDRDLYFRIYNQQFRKRK